MIIFAEGPLHDMLLEVAKRGIDADGFLYPKTAAVMRNKSLAAICVYHNYAPPDIQMSFYALTPRWAHMSVIRDLLAYPFVQLGVRRVTALVSKRNKRSRRMVTGLGWSLEGTIRKGAKDGGNLLIYGMLAEEFGERYGSVKTSLSARTATDHAGQVQPTAPDGGQGRADAASHPGGSAATDCEPSRVRAGAASARGSHGRTEPSAARTAPVCAAHAAAH